MTQIYLVRHAEAEGNLFRRAQGQFDGMVTAQGYRQLARLRERFRPLHIDAVYASDLRRTRITSAAIAEPKALTVQLCPRLREFSLGCWEDTPWSEWAAQDAASLLAFNTLDAFCAPGSETPQQVRERICAEFWRIAAENEGKTVAIVSHGMALRILMGALEGLCFEQMRTAPHSDNTAVSLIEVTGQSARIVFRDDNSHLGELSTFARQKWWRNRDHAPDPALRFRAADASLRDDALTLLRAAQEEGCLSAEGMEAALRLFDQPQSPARLAYWQGQTAGIVLPTEEDCRFYLLPALRGNHLGIQLLGEGIAVLRRRGSSLLRCRCADPALALYLTHYGFDRAGLLCSLPIDINL